jgi:hypothetical protein
MFKSPCPCAFAAAALCVSLASASELPQCEFANTQPSGWKVASSIDAHLQFRVPADAESQVDPEAIHSFEVWRSQNLEVRVVTGHVAANRIEGTCRLSWVGRETRVRIESAEGTVASVMVLGGGEGLDAVVTVLGSGANAREFVDAVLVSLADISKR